MRYNTVAIVRSNIFFPYSTIERKQKEKCLKIGQEVPKAGNSSKSGVIMMLTWYSVSMVSVNQR